MGCPPPNHVYVASIMTVKTKNDPNDPAGAVEKRHEKASSEPLGDWRGIFAMIVVPSGLHRTIVTQTGIIFTRIPYVRHVASFCPRVLWALVKEPL